MKGQTIAASGFSQTQYYEYDATNRLKIAVEGAPVPGSLTCPATSSWCREYNYDHFGNRWVTSNRTMHMAVPTSQGAFNPGNNRLAAGGYDAAGNMTSHPYITPGGSMAYNANNLMTSFTATGVSVQTAYDDAGRRVRKIKGTEVTLWVYSASGRLAAEYRNGTGPGFAASTPEREYSYGVGRLVAVHEGTNRYYRTTDHLGSTRIVTDQTGTVKQRRDFFPFGEEIPADSSHGGRNAVLDGGVATYNASLGVRQQFTGQQRDAETGLDDFRIRMFAAPMARFLSIDPGNRGVCPSCPQTWNAFLYAKNSPFRFIDDGFQAQCPPDSGTCIDVIEPPPPNVPTVTEIFGGRLPFTNRPGPPLSGAETDPQICDVRGAETPGCPQYRDPGQPRDESLDTLNTAIGGAEWRLKYFEKCAAMFGAGRNPAQHLVSLQLTGKIRVMPLAALGNSPVKDKEGIGGFNAGGEGGLIYFIEDRYFFTGKINGLSVSGNYAEFAGLTDDQIREVMVIHELMHQMGIVGADSAGQTYKLPNGTTVTGSGGITEEIIKNCI